MAYNLSRPSRRLSQEGVMTVPHARIAAEFEHCVQLFHALCSAMEANSPTWSTKIALMSEYRRALLDWGSVTGAVCPSLDHTLRKNSRLRDQVLELLEEFNEALRSILDDVQMTAVPLLSPAMIEAPSQSYFDILTGSNVGIQTFTVSEQALQSKLEIISATLDRLQRLVPSLDHPFPRDLFLPGILQNDDQGDFNTTSKMFPKASTLIKERLSRANWQRRCFLRHLRAVMRGERVLHDPTFTSSASSEHMKATVTPIPSYQSTPQKFAIPEYRSVFSRKTSMSETMSNSGTIFSKPDSVSEYTAATSIVDVEEPTRPKLLTVPNPPVTLTNGVTFQCPYCAQDILVGDNSASRLQELYDSLAGIAFESATTYPPGPPAQSTKTKIMEVATNTEWVNHVYADLEPYICTFDNCQQAQMTYATRQEWILHEMNMHRSSKLWYCQLCDKNWVSQEIFEEHLQSMHMVPADQSTIIASLCEKQTGPSSDQLKCQLCTFTSTTPDSLISHVAQHLEQLALTSIEEEDDRSRDEVRLSSHGQAFPSHFARNLAWVESLISAQTPSLFRDGRNPEIQASTARASETDLPLKSPSKPIGSQNRPAGPHRGPSYTYQIRAREQKTTETRTDLLKKQEVPITQAVRTLAPPRNTDFVGRISDMANMHSSLTVPGNICILSGVGGLGKSALATEYTYRFETAYSCIFWVQAETPMICADTYCQIALKVVPASKGQLEERLITLGREFLETTSKRWLLVFDNVDHWFDLQRFLPVDMSQTTGNVLITTQLQDIKFPDTNVRCAKVDLGVLPLEESRRLLLSSANLGHNSADLKAHPEYKLAGDIAKMAARLPLALSLIAGFVLVSDCSLAEFVELWKERQETMQVSAQPSNENDPEAEKAMETAWNIGLRAVTTDARELLNILAFLDSDTIQKSLLVGEHQEPLLRFLHSSQPGRYRRMTSELRKRRLISVETREGEETLSIHRKLQVKILQELNTKDNRAQRERVFNQVFLLVRSKFPNASPVQIPEPEKWPICKKYLPHVLSIRRLALGSVIDITPSVKLARLFSDGGIDLWERGLTSEGLELLKSAEVMLDQLAVGEELLRADIHVIVSLLLQDAGMSHIAECKDRIWTALQIRLRYQERCPALEYTKNDEILLYNAWADYACVLLQYNKFMEAEPIFDNCLAKYKEWDEPENIPYEYAKYYHHVAFCRMYRGEHVDAVHLAEQGLHWVEAATGKDSAAATRWKFDLACVVFQSGSQERALELHQEVLAARLKLHGKFGFLTFQSTYAVAATYAALGDLALAETNLRQILDLEEARPGTCSEAALARTQFHLSQVLSLILQNKDSMTEKASTDATTTDIGQIGGESVEADAKETSEIDQLASIARRVLEKPHPLGKLGDGNNGRTAIEIPRDHELAKFDYQQPIFDGRFTGLHILPYVGQKEL